MTVAEVITKIGKITETIDYLERLRERLNLRNGDAVAVMDAEDELRAYIDELEKKIVN